MSRAQDRGSGLQSGDQGAQTGATGSGTGTTAGAGATGSTPSTPTTTTTTTTTGTGVRDRERGMLRETPSQASYGRGSEPATGYRTEARGTSTGSSLGGSFAVLAGLLTFLAGLGAVIRRGFYPRLPGYAYTTNVHTWGWVLLVLGVLLFAVGACALLGMTWARAAGIGLAVLTGVAAFLFLPFSPFWGIVLVLLSVVAIWGLVRDHQSV
jgi:hypothetical protein